MGTRTMTFKTLEGDAIAVTFTGDGVSDGELTAASDPVVINMDGSGREYAAVKYATATVTCVTNGLELQELYTDSINVRVEIYNKTTGEMLFLGAVTPNTFSQTITGYNDELSIECVDMLGAAKFLPYEKAGGDEAPFQALTIAQVVLNAVAKLGLSSAYLTDNIVITPRHQEYSTSSYELMTIAEQYFYEDLTPQLLHTEEGEDLSYKGLAMTWYEVLEMLAESLRCTWAQIGRGLYLHDPVALRETGTVSYKELISSGVLPTLTQSMAMTLTEESFDSGSTQLNVLPHYTLFSVENKSEEEVAVFPDLFAHQLFEPKGYGTTVSDDDETVKRYVRLETPLFASIDESAYLKAYMMAYTEIKRPDIAKNDATGYWKKKRYGEDWTPVFFIREEDRPAGITLLSLGGAYRFAIPARSRARLRLSIEIGFDGTYSYYPEPSTNGDKLLFIQLLSDGLYYNEITQSWSSTPHDIILVFPSGTAWRKDFSFATATYATAAPDIIAPVNGAGVLELRVMSGEDEGWKSAWIKKLNLMLVDPHVYRETNDIDRLPEVVYSQGTYENELDTVSFPIQLEPTLAEKIFGTLINDVEYCDELDRDNPDTTRSAAEFRFKSGPSQYTMLQRIEKMANASDNYELTLPLRDEHNAISLNTAYTSSLWGGIKAVVGYEKNVIDNSINVTIN